MNKILANFGFGVVLTNKSVGTAPAKKTLEGVYVFRADGMMLDYTKCLPKDRIETIKELMERYPRAEIFNIKMLNGHTKVIRRNEV